MIDPVLFGLAVLTLLGTPGPTNTLLATSGAASGISRSLPLLAAELAGYAIAVAAIRLVLGPLINAFPVVGIGLKLAVVFYLGWVAYRLWTHNAALAGTQTVSWRSVFVTTLLNPKALIFALGIIPAEHPQLFWYFVAFAVAVPGVGFGWILVGRAIGAASGERHAGLIRRVASVALVGFAGMIAASVLR